YDGIEAALAFFKGEKMRIYTATSKSQIMSEELTKKFGIFKYFDKIYGADASVCRVDKADVLRYALADSGENPGSGLLIGDTPYDAEGAELVGMDCLAVTYGFGRREDMTGGRVVGYAANAAEIISVFLRIALK
ncbi:MAG: HAD hydrolase-like protein, partial [Clostridiales bacterium]|nr:HAD hydrolase-like protein [Clostridiales bacterium]